MEPTTLTTVAETMAGLGALGVATAALNLVALRVVPVDEVPIWLRARIRWWTTHNPAFLVISAVVAAAGLATLGAASM